MTPPAVGVDGCPGGWIAAQVDGRSVRWSLVARIDGLLADRPGAVFAIDMPIGLVDSGPRAADLAARAWLAGHGGPPSSIFLTPSRPVVRDHGLGHPEAMRRARARGEPGTSIQAWNLVAKIVELGHALERHPVRAVEAHPECSVRMLDPRVGGSKKTARGAGSRLRALAGWCDVTGALAELPVDGSGRVRPALDDALDALAVAWTAARVARGGAVRLPDPSPDGTCLTI